MPKLSELVTQNPIGTKYFFGKWEPSAHFVPAYFDGYYWVGFSEHGVVCSYFESDGWQVWQPPKTKIKRWLWDVDEPCASTPFRTDIWLTEKEAGKRWPYAKLEKVEEKEFDR